MTTYFSFTPHHVIISLSCSVNSSHFHLLALKFVYLPLSRSIFFSLCMWIFTLFFNTTILKILNVYLKNDFVRPKHLWWEILFHNLSFVTSKCSCIGFYLVKVGYTCFWSVFIASLFINFQMHFILLRILNCILNVLPFFLRSSI